MEYTYRFGSFDGKHLQTNDKRKKRGARILLVLCLTAAMSACAVKYFFPNETADFLKRIGYDDGYARALETLGHIVSGDDAGSDEEENGVSVFNPGPVEYDVVYEENPELEETVIPMDGVSYDEAAVAEFTERQAAYEKYGIPAKASYAMPELPFDYICPVMGPVTSSFGYRVHPNDNIVRFHYGTDLGVPEGTEIVSFADGVIKAVGNSSSYGKYVMVEHEGGTVTMFAHCSKICVSEGDNILKGDKVAESGSTGNATGDCVHFEVIVDGKYVNPEYYVSWS